MTVTTPTVLLVHGAFADASMWAGVIAELQAAGVPVAAPANPLRGVAHDGAYLATIATAVDGPVLLVGHSYGGVVITRAAAEAAGVVGLVYVAAFALAEGESPVALMSRYPGTLMGAALRPATFPGANGEPEVELYVRADRYAPVFAADLPEAVTAVSAVAQRPVAAAAFEESSPAAPWRTLPSWYVVATADQAIHPDAQREMARRAGASTVELDASHSVMTSQPAAVAEHIRSAAEALARQTIQA